MQLLTNTLLSHQEITDDCHGHEWDMWPLHQHFPRTPDQDVGALTEVLTMWYLSGKRCQPLVSVIENK